MIEKSEVKELLDTLSYRYSEVEQLEGAVGWSIEVDYPSTDAPAVVSAQEGEPIFLVVSRGLTVAEEHRDIIGAFPTDQYSRLRFDLMRDLLLKDVLFRFEDGPGNQEMKAVRVGVEVWEGDLTPGSLKKALQRIVDAILLTRARIRKAVKDAQDD